MLRRLDLKGMSEFADGTVDAAFDKHMKRAILDCEDRPGDIKARKVTLTAYLTPVVMQDGAVTDVHVDCEVSSATPKHISKTVECRIKHGGQAVFNDMSGDHVDQMTLDEQEQ